MAVNYGAATSTELSTGPGAAAHIGLSREQLGHIRRIQSLANQLPNDWSGMQGKGGQDGFGGYRFQLAYAAYALALAYRHRLPNAPGVFKSTFARLIDKMLLPDVWMYWRDSSRGGNLYNAHLDDKLQEEWDPIGRDNIMYSAYLQSMSTMFNLLFDDDRYARPGALSIEHWSFFWGGDAKRFPYDQNTLNEHLYWLMVENGYLGIACEPNCVFQICNQPAIIGFRLHDILTGGNLAEDVVAGYERAWSDYGRIDENGHYVLLITEDDKVAHNLPNEFNPWADAWCGALMNSWNREFVHNHYPRQISKYVVPDSNGALQLVPTPPVLHNGKPIERDTNDFGWVAVWASEMGDQATLDGLLAHADRYMNPTWQDGALYYPRCDAPADEQGNATAVGPLTGNSLLSYARLNVADGMWTLYNKPWDRSHFREPLVVDLSESVDLTRAEFDRTARQLIMRVAQREGYSAGGRIDIANVASEFGLSVDGRETDDVDLSRQGELLSIPCPSGGPHELILTVPTWEAR